MLLSILLFLAIIAVIWYILQHVFARNPQFVPYRTHSNVLLVILIIVAVWFMWHGGHFR